MERAQQAYGSLTSASESGIGAAIASANGLNAVGAAARNASAEMASAESVLAKYADTSEAAAATGTRDNYAGLAADAEAAVKAMSDIDAAAAANDAAIAEMAARWAESGTEAQQAMARILSASTEEEAAAARVEAQLARMAATSNDAAAATQAMAQADEAAVAAAIARADGMAQELAAILAVTESVEEQQDILSALGEAPRGFDWSEMAANYETAMLRMTQSTQELVNQGYLLPNSLLASSAAADTLGASAAESGDRIADLGTAAAAAGAEAQELGAAQEEAQQGIRAIGEEASAAANGGFDTLLKKLKSLAVQYLGFKALKAVVTDALKTDSYEVIFQARFGDEAGADAAAWARSKALEMGQSVTDVMSGIDAFSSLTGNSEAIEKLIALSDRMAGYSGKSFAEASSAMAQTMRTGRTMGLTSVFGISKAALESSGFDAAAEAGDYKAMAEALERAADSAGKTAEGFEKIDTSASGALSDFKNNVKNMANGAAQSLIAAFAPAFNKLNAWLKSEGAQKFFRALSLGASLAGKAFGLLTNILMKAGEFIGNNLEPIVIGLGAAFTIMGVKAVVAGIQAAIAWIAAAWPLLLIVGIITLVIIAIHKLGYSFEQIFSTIGKVVGGAVAVIVNLFVGLWNYLATIANNLARLFTDPVGAIVGLFTNMADTVLGILQTLAEAIDAIFGTDWGAGLQNTRDKMNGWFNDKYGATVEVVKTLERVSTDDFVNKGGEIGAAIGSGIDNFSLEDTLSSFTQGGSLGGIEDILGEMNSGGVKIKDEVDLSDEDVKMIKDIAERRYVVQVNMSQVTPSVNVEVNNSNGDLSGEDVSAAMLRALENDIFSSPEGVYVR
jgi:hypothetical protein